jgi:hypothetical protein
MKKNREVKIEPIRRNPRKIDENDSAVILGITSVRNINTNIESNSADVPTLENQKGTGSESNVIGAPKKKPVVKKPTTTTASKKRKKYEPTKIHDLKLNDTIAIVMKKMSFKTKQQAYTYAIQRLAEIISLNS